MQALMTMMMGASRDKPVKQIIAPAARWGMVVEKPAGDEQPGVVVKEVHAGSAAAAAGIQAGDRLLSLDSRWTDSVNECYQAAAHVPAGTAARVVLQRGGKELVVTVKPASGL
jgi:S1-C subfamily serine protease